MISRLGLACAVAVLLWGMLPGSTPRAAPPRSQSADSTALGVVWTPPDAPGPALQELDRIHALGATAVRLTRLPPVDTVVARADTLGLSLFVDLPVSYVAAGALRDSLAGASSQLDRLQRLARQHPSVQYVGLAHSADTTVPLACSVLREWTDRLRSAPASLGTYYVTPFAASADRCANAVDLVLLDTRGQSAPVDQWTRWDATPPTGIGALGTWRAPNASSGLRVPHSPERQARYLERHLTRLLDAPPPALFVHRWQDRGDALLSGRRYGLHDATGTRRPAANVVAGIYTDTQRVFAFPKGTPPPSAPHGLLLLGWGLIALLAGLYAQRPFVRQTAFRYFAAHGFYRDAVRKGRDVSPAVNTILLALIVTALGLMTAVIARIAALQPVTEHVIATLPPFLSGLLATGVATPVLAGTVVGGLALALLGGWTLALVVAARPEGPFSMAQGLMLVVWPCWPVLPGLVVALVTSTHPPLSPVFLGSLLLGGGALTLVAIPLRILRDYQTVSDVPGPRLLGLALASPPSLLGLTAAAIAVRQDLPLSLIWHLLTQT